MNYDKNEFPDDIKELLENVTDCLHNGKAEDATKLLTELNDAGFPEAQKLLQATVKETLGMITAEKYTDAKAEVLKLFANYGYDYTTKYPPPQKLNMVFHASVKSIEKEGRIIEGYASVTGIKDREGEIMESSAFNKGIDTFMENPVLLFSHDIKKPIGKVLELTVKPTGLWIKAQIAEGTQQADEAWSLIEQGVLKAFSVGGFFEKMKNVLTRWDLTEVSVCAVPTNRRALFSVAKGFELGTDLIPSKIHEYIKELKETSEKILLTENKDKVSSAIKALLELLDSESLTVESEAEKLYTEAKKEVETIMATESEKLIAEITKNVRTQINEENAAAEEASKSLKEHDDEIGTKAVEEWKEEQKKTAAAKGLPFEFPDDAQVVVSSKYDELETPDLAFMHTLLRASGKSISPEMTKALATSVKKDIDSGYAQKMGYGIKTNEVLFSTQTGYGDEWVPDLWSSVLWKTIRMDAKVAGLFPSIEMPSQPYEYPLDSTGPTIYKVAEAANETELVIGAQTIPESKVATAKVTFSAGKMGALTYFTEDLVEDSIIPILPQLRAQFAEDMAHAIDDVVINGDEESSQATNISYATGADKRLILYGLRYQGLKSASAANKYDAGTLTVDDIQKLRTLMGAAGKYGVDISKLVIISDPAAYQKLVILDEVITVDKFGPAATILKGQLGALLGIPIIVSEDYPLTASTGEIDASGNTLGSLLLVRKDGCMLGWRRHVKMTVGNVPFSDAHFILATCRFDIQYLNAEMVAIAYNITV